MGEEIKEIIHEFLKNNKGQEFSVFKLREGMEKAGMKYSYHTVLKWIAVLNAESGNGIEIKDYGSIKIISYVGDGE